MKTVTRVVLLFALLGACGGGTTSEADCAGAGVRVDVGALPRQWIAHGRFTLCQDEICSTQEAPFTSFYGRGPFLARSRGDQTPVAVTLRVEVGGVQVVRARTAGKVRPSPTQHGELSETCGALITLAVGSDHTKLEARSSS